MSQQVAGCPAVSVVMPVYNGEKFLPEAIDSILNQSLIDFEFIIVNDGSADDTSKILHSYSDERMHLIERENRGFRFHAENISPGWMRMILPWKTVCNCSMILWKAIRMWRSLEDRHS